MTILQTISNEALSFLAQRMKLSVTVCLALFIGLVANYFMSASPEIFDMSVLIVDQFRRPIQAEIIGPGNESRYTLAKTGIAMVPLAWLHKTITILWGNNRTHYVKLLPCVNGAPATIILPSK